MKKTLLLLATSVILLSNQACKKMDNNQAVNETVNVTINSNESYRYSLPSTNSDANYGVVTPSAKSAIIGFQSSGTNNEFVYTPAQNYSGTDEVVISNTASQQNGGGCGHHHSNGCCQNSCGGGHKHHHGNSNCGSKHGNKHTITFKIAVNGTVN